MGHIKFLLKFGEESHLKEFAKGSLYCSNAETFWGIEDKQKIKGQGIFSKLDRGFFLKI